MKWVSVEAGMPYWEKRSDKANKSSKAERDIVTGAPGHINARLQSMLWCGQVTGMTEQNRQGHCPKETEILCMRTVEHANLTWRNPWRQSKPTALCMEKPHQ